MARIPIIALTLATALPALAKPPAAESDAAPGRSLARQLAARAVKSNPSIHALRTQIHALQARIKQAGAWLDPQVAIEYSNMPIDAWIPGKHAMSGIQLKFQQTFYWPGKIGLREAVAKGNVRVARQSLAERKVQLRSMVERAYFQLALVRQLRKVTEEHIKLVDQFVDVVRIKYEVGKAGQHDLIRLQVLAAQLRDDLKGFDRDDKALVAVINATLHRPAKTAVPTPPRVKVPSPPGDENALLTAAVKHRPALKRFLEVARTRRLAARRAAKEGYPDFTASVGYRIRVKSGTDPGTNFIGLGLSMPIPLTYDSRWGSERRANERRAREAEQRRSAEIDSIRGELGKVLARWRRAAQEAKTYKTKLMPLAHRALDSTFAAYQVDRADFASLFQAELQLLAYERTIRRAEVGAVLARVAVEALMGRRLER